MTGLDNDSDNKHDQRPGGWRRWLVVGSFGLLMDAAVNVFSADLGHRGVVFAAVVLAVAAAGNWMRGFPVRSTLVRFSVPVMLGLALVDAAATLVTPRPLAAPLTVVAAALTVGAILIPRSIADAILPLAIASAGGIGLAFVGIGVVQLIREHILLGAAITSLGVAFLGVATAWLFPQIDLFEFAAGIGGLAVIGVGMAELGAHQIALGAMMIAVGVVGIVAAMAELFVIIETLGVAGISLGIIFVSTGIVGLIGNRVVFGTLCVGIGVTSVGGGVANIAGSDINIVADMIFFGGGVGIITAGILGLLNDEFLLGAAFIGAGAAVSIGAIGSLYRTGVLRRTLSWLAKLAQDNEVQST